MTKIQPISEEVRNELISQLKNPENKDMYVQGVLYIEAEDQITGESKPICYCAEGLLYKIIKNFNMEGDLINQITPSTEPASMFDIKHQSYLEFNGYPENFTHDEVITHQTDILITPEIYEKAQNLFKTDTGFDDNILLKEYAEIVIIPVDEENLETRETFIASLPKIYLNNISSELREAIINAIAIDPIVSIEPNDEFFETIFGENGIEMYMLNDSGIEFELMARIIEETGWGK